MNTTSALEVRGLWKGYAGNEVLRGLDLDVPEGSLSAVLGLSGCGKTTLLRVIAGFERAQQGQVLLAGRVLEDERTHIAPERRDIGYVPQEGALFPHLDVQANVGFGLTRAERRGSTVSELLKMVGLSPLAKRMPHQLSGGEQQRAALARALARKPALLLLDEPFSSLDATLRGAVREEVSALVRRQGTTTVLVTHDQEEALSLADSVAVLRNGQIIQQGPPQDIYSTPQDAGLANFLGEANLVEATLIDGRAQTALGALPLRGQAHQEQPRSQGIVVIRPEQLKVRATSENEEGLRGIVERCRYYGHDALLTIRPSDTARPVAPLLARVAGEQSLAVGTHVTVTAAGAVSAIEDSSK